MQNNTVHRDIKPSNLLLDNDGKVWITDFGLAKIRDTDTDLSKTGDMIGTPRYMAPEQIRGNADERSDIYGLGVTLWELATGKQAWDAVNQGDIISVKASIELPEVLEMNPDVPARLAGIIDKACAFDPDQRYQTAKELQHVLNRFAHGEKVSDRRRTPRDGRPRPWLRAPFLLMGLAAAILFGLLLTNWLPANGSVPPQPFDWSRGIDVAELTTTVPLPVKISPAQYSIAGPDRDHFVWSNSGSLEFTFEPDFEDPQDQGRDNCYQLELLPGDAADETDVICFSVRVRDVDEPLQFTVSDTGTYHMEIESGGHELDLNGFCPIDPEGRGWSVRIVGGQDSERFRTAGNHSLIADSGLAPRDTPYEVVVEFIDRKSSGQISLDLSSDRRTALLKLDQQHAVRAFSDPNLEFDPLMIRGIDTQDGRELYAVHIRGANAELWRLELNPQSQLVNADCVSRDCGLHAGVEAITSHNVSAQTKRLRAINKLDVPIIAFRAVHGVRDDDG